MGEGGIYGCGCKQVYRFPHTIPLVSVIFCSSIPTFCSFKKLFFSFLFQYFFVMKFYVLNNIFAQFKYIRATTRVPRQPYEGCT